MIPGKILTDGYNGKLFRMVLQKQHQFVLYEKFEIQIFVISLLLMVIM